MQLKQLAHAAIEDRYKCAHLNREVRRRVIADGRISYVSQCIECGHTSSPISASRALAQSQSPPHYDEFIQSRLYAAKTTEYQKVFFELNPTLKAEYRTYLASPEWAQKRATVIFKANGLCEICAEPATQVHHLHYQNVGSELENDLMALCRFCHEFIHTKAEI